MRRCASSASAAWSRASRSSSISPPSCRCIEWSRALAREGVATFVISVPNDAFWSMQNPHHATSWGEGAFEELRRLLPDEQTLLRQVALSGSAALAWDAPSSDYELAVAVGGEGAVPTHFVAAYGPRHAELRRGALVTQADMLEQRRWERQRENDLALMQKVARGLRRDDRGTAARAARADGLVRGVAKVHPRARARARPAALGRLAGRAPGELAGAHGGGRGGRGWGGPARHRGSRREGRLPRQRPPALRGRGGGDPARAAPQHAPGLGRDAGAGARRGGRELARLRAPSPPARAHPRGGAAGALRRRACDLVGDRVHALRARGRAPRVLRAEPRGPLLPGATRRSGSARR